MAGIRRGDVVLAAAAWDYGKPRPWLVVQANKHNDTGRPGSILVCPFTTHDEALSYRIPVDLPLGDTLRRSWVMVGQAYGGQAGADRGNHRHGINRSTQGRRARDSRST